MQRILWTVFCTVFSVSAFSEPELKGTPRELKGFLYPEPSVMTIYGEAEEIAYGDTAILSLVVTTENKLLLKSLASNAEIRKNIEDALIKSGLAADQIKRSEFFSSAEYGWFSKEPTSHKVVNRMVITVSQESQLMDVAALTDEYDEVELADTTFKHSQEEQSNARVLAQALANVTKQQREYESSLGVVLTPIRVRSSYVQPLPTRGALLRAGVSEAYSNENVRLEAYADAVELEQLPQAQSFDEVTYTVNVSVDFKIENRNMAQ